jgi:hypothetical protein
MTPPPVRLAGGAQRSTPTRNFFLPGQIGAVVFGLLPLIVRAASGAFRRVTYSGAGIAALAILMFLLLYMVRRGARGWWGGGGVHIL